MKYFVLLILLSLTVNSQTLTSIYFQNNSANLSENSKVKLDSLANLNSKLTFRIFGNANPLGNEELNKSLSEKRAKNVTDYLKTRIGSNINVASSVGLGISKQINDNSSENLLARNRRVDIFIDQILDSGEIKSGKSFASFFSMKVSEMKVGDVFSLPDVNFVGGRHVWLPKGEKMLIQLANILKDNPNVVVELQGHICCDYDNFDGEDLDLKTFNLSFTRANAIKEFLIKQGINSKRIKATGQGHLNPVVYPERKEEDFMKNRRVEIVLLKK